MKLVINHQTHYHYDTMVKRSNQYIRLTPQSIGHQKVNAWQLAAQGIHFTQEDGFGNVWTNLTYNQPHHELLIMAQGEIETHDVEGVLDNRLAPMIFTHSTDITRCHEPLVEFTARFANANSRSQLIELSAAILDAMPYTPASTTVETTASPARKASATAAPMRMEEARIIGSTSGRCSPAAPSAPPEIIAATSGRAVS